MTTEPFTHLDGPYTIQPDGSRLYLAQLITNASPSDTVIYLNGDPLDNRRENLLVVKGDRPVASIRRRRR